MSQQSSNWSQNVQEASYTLKMSVKTDSKQHFPDGTTLTTIFQKLDLGSKLGSQNRA